MAIIPYKSPKITKLDGRYKLYNRGFRYKVSFDAMKNYQSFLRALTWCENAWGPERKVWNSNWLVTIADKNKWWREIYLCREEDVTMMLLVAGG